MALRVVTEQDVRLFARHAFTDKGAGRRPIWRLGIELPVLVKQGGQRRKVESILRRAGYAPEKNRFVGLRNYADILAGKVSDQFYPRSYVKSLMRNSGMSRPTRVMMPSRVIRRLFVNV